MNPLLRLKECGQSVWYDNIQRSLLTSGELKRLIVEDGISGVTSNPTIFHKAIAGSQDYEEALSALIKAGKSTEEIYESLVIEDIRMSSDLLRPIYEETGGRDGYVSLEVSPHLACDTEATVAEARRLRQAIGRENVMIKVPATLEGLPAIEALIASDVNVNVTLIFALERYEQVAEAYIAGLERRRKEGRPLGSVASVASFFVSRIDTMVDKALAERIEAARDPRKKEALRSLMGQAAVANAKLAYQKFKEIFGSERFEALRRAGARVQRPLWASTSTKNPAYSNILYVQPLIGPDTVNTMPPQTIEAFRDHGKARITIEEGLDEAHEVMRRLQEEDIDLGAVTRKLLEDGVKAFADSFDALLASIRAKK